MKNVIIDTMGEFAASQIIGYQSALAGLVAEAMNPNAQPRRVMLATMQRLQASTLTALAAVFDTAVTDVAHGAVVNAYPDTPDQVAAQVATDARATRDAALGTVSQALARDAEVAHARIRDFHLKVEMLLASGGRGYSSAVIAAGISERARGITFGQTDTLGRRWKSSQFISATLRGALQGIYADAFVRAAAAHGASSVALQYADPEHEGHGQVIPFAESDDAPGYLSLRNEIFHPNSRATLVRVDHGDSDVPGQ
jgi:hypothetical protein